VPAPPLSSPMRFLQIFLLRVEYQPRSCCSPPPSYREPETAFIDFLRKAENGRVSAHLSPRQHPLPFDFTHSSGIPPFFPPCLTLFDLCLGQARGNILFAFDSGARNKTFECSDFLPPPFDLFTVSLIFLLLRRPCNYWAPRSARCGFFYYPLLQNLRPSRREARLLGTNAVVCGFCSRDVIVAGPCPKPPTIKDSRIASRRIPPTF